MKCCNLGLDWGYNGKENRYHRDYRVYIGVYIRVASTLEVRRCKAVVSVLPNDPQALKPLTLGDEPNRILNTGLGALGF